MCAAISADLDRIYVHADFASRNEKHFHVTALFRGASGLIESHRLECSFEPERVGLSYLL